MAGKTLVKFLLILILVPAGFWAYQSRNPKMEPPPPAPQELMKVEDALAAPNLVALWHFNSAYSYDVFKTYAGGRDLEALPTFEKKDDSSFLNVLHRSGVDEEDIDHVIGGFLGDGKTAGSIMVVLGNFDPEELHDHWEEIDGFKQAELNGSPAWTFAPVNVSDCKQAKPMTIITEPHRLIVGDPQWVTFFLDRLKGHETQLDLKRWRAYRKDKLISGAVFAPKDLKKIKGHMIYKIALHSMNKKLIKVSGVYGGLSVSKTSPGVDAEILVDDDDAEWNRQQEKEFLEWKQKTLEELDEDMSSVKELLEFFNVSATDRQLVLKASFNRDFLKQIQTVARQVLQSIFSSFTGSSSITIGDEDKKEQILSRDKVNPYTLLWEPDELEPFDPKTDEFKNFIAVTGPFGLYINKLAMNSKEPGVMDLELYATSSIIPNVENATSLDPEDAIGGQIYITHVWGKDGRELLREETCGQDRNSRFTKLSKSSIAIYKKDSNRSPLTRKYFDARSHGKDFIWAEGLAGSKTVRLKPGTKVSNIDRIEGRIKLLLPTEISKEQVQAPFKDQVVSTRGVRVKMRKSEPRSIGYFLSGETHRLLEVRTYNREGKYLAWAGSSSTSVFQSEGKSTTQNFKGQPEAAELIIAGEIEEETFPFDFKFSRPSPPPNQGLWEVNVPTMTLAAYESQRLPKPLLKYCKQKKKPHAITGNVGLCLSDLEIKYRHFGKNQGDYVQTHISLDVPHPHPPALDWNLSGAKVVITKINFKNEKTGKTRSQPVQIEEFINLNSTGVNLDSEIMEMKDEKATGIEGYLQINLPAKLSKLTLDLSELGNQAENDAGLKVKLTGFSSDGAKFDVTGPREKVVQYQPRDRQGKALKQSFPSIRWSKKKESWWGKVAIPAHAKTLDIVYATRQEQKRYPFKIRK